MVGVTVEVTTAAFTADMAGGDIMAVITTGIGEVIMAEASPLVFRSAVILTTTAIRITMVTATAMGTARRDIATRDITAPMDTATAAMDIAVMPTTGIGMQVATTGITTNW